VESNIVAVGERAEGGSKGRSGYTMGRSVCKQQQVNVRNLVLVVLCVHALFPDQLSCQQANTTTDRQANTTAGQRTTGGTQLPNDTYVYNGANGKFS
jgi:hypothetical protein